MVSDDVSANYITSKALEFIGSVEMEIPNVYRSTNTTTTTSPNSNNINVKTSTWRYS